jgi:hypothetical protein
MSQAFDYNGFVVAPSVPKKTLRTVKKTIHIDSVDRDTARYHTNGDWIAFLPRTYKNVVSIRLVEAMFPTVVSVTYQTAGENKQSPGAIIRTFDGNTPGGSDSVITANGHIPYYFMIDLKGLNKADECAVNANKSTYVDGYFAKIPIILSDGGPGMQNLATGLPPSTWSTVIEYNDKTYHDNIGKYSPPIENLDRIQIRTRLHSQQGDQGFIYWTSDGTLNGSRNGTSNYSLTLEIEMLENAFDEFSSFETRIRQ